MQLIFKTQNLFSTLVMAHYCLHSCKEFQRLKRIHQQTPSVKTYYWGIRSKLHATISAINSEKNFIILVSLNSRLSNCILKV